MGQIIGITGGFVRVRRIETTGSQLKQLYYLTMGSETNKTINHNLQTPPRVTGNVRELVRAPHRFFLALTRQYGDIVQYRAAPEPAYLVNHPDFVKHVLISNGRNYNKDTHLNKHMLQGLTGQGLLTSENPLWRKQRRLMQPAFHRKSLVKFVHLMQDATNQMLDRLDLYASQGAPFDMADEMMKLTLNIVSRVLFGYNIDKQAQQVGQALNTLIAIGKPGRRRSQEMIKVLDEVVYDIIHQRRQQPHDDQHDLLDMLVQARYEDTGQGMGDQQIRDEIMSLLVAGHETTANTLSWLWYQLGQHPDVVAKIEVEIDNVLNGRLPAVADFAELQYCDKVIKESMRLYPSAWSISRRALADDQMGGYFIPAGAVVALSPYTLHRHQAFWPEPEAFDPERFTAEQEAARHRYAYIPFGAGARKCIGDQFALMESIVILPMTLQRFQLRLVPEHTVEEHALITLRPRHGIMMTAATRGS